ncbi:auxilin-related protein 2 isoform X1 [Cynara cardunculus var. scolymus]|uniref:J domain-containing protein n=2 Tax=Cynara cardunculus var. scolymus TaxID=59895 RepID=A0A103YLU8_CYNCS|nr:auxilin-related protein 2 isoform X1 [Cynara cardunculus var. scolymus]KVI11469.1 hypothetical protein Ccrd_010133 [Cynara cardunculus var. scolymus]
MDDFGMLARDFGFRPQGKSAPMKSDGVDFRSRAPSSSSPFVAEENQIFSDVFGGPPKFTNNNSRSTSAMSDIDYDSIFKNSASTNSNEAKSKSTSPNLPVYDKPVYDDDIFDGLPGMKSKSMHSASARYEDNIFASMTASPPKRSQQSDHFDDLLGNLGRTEKVEPPKHKTSKSPRGLDDLLPGFGSGGPASSSRSNSESAPLSTGNTKETSNGIDDPFVVLESTSTPATSSQGVFIDPLETIHRFSKSASTNAGGSSANGGMFDDLDPLHGFGKPAPAFSNESNKGKDQSPFKEGSGMGSSRSSTRREPPEKSSFTYSESQPQKVPLEDFPESQQTIFDMPAVSKVSQRSVDQTTSPPSYTETSSQVDMSPTSEEYVQPADDIWLTVSEIPLFTQPTRAPPPSRPPPPIPRHASKSERGSFASNTRTVGNDYSASPNSAKFSQSYNPFQPVAKSSMVSPLDELENFAMGGMPDNGEDDADAQYGEEMDSNSAAAAMKDAMDRAEAKFKHAKEVREREHAKASRSKESMKLQKDEVSMEEESKRERQERERQQREREEQEREQSRLEKVRKDIEREKARQAVERATREARERAAAEARERASAEARLKSERAAVQRAQAEARERAAIDARGRAERAAAEARERASAESSERAAAEAREKAAREKAAVARAEADAKRRSERIAVERVAAEARERAAVEARDRAAAAARMNQQKNDNDLESFFNMGSRPSSAPRPRTASDSATDPLSQNRRGQEGAQRTSTTSNMRKASSTTNIVDDLSSIFGAAPSSAGGFQDVEGETEERRRARLERHQRTQDRAAKALEEKNQRDLQSQREQEERSRIGETLDSEIKRWAAGKEGNLRALLSTLQYVLWPGCGWQPLSLTDLITGVNVKKAYRKATLCIHPDKVQQKGANLQQKYVAEKVFDILKEAWNKFNSEELF